jgi:hypothetical protein
MSSCKRRLLPSPLRGGGGGGGIAGTELVATPLPNPPPQGGRERAGSAKTL